MTAHHNDAPKWKIPNIQGTAARNHHALGTRAYRQGNYQSARQHFAAALACYQNADGLERSQAACMVNLGASMLALGRHPEALQLYTQALKRLVGCFDAQLDKEKLLTNLGVILDDLGQLTEAKTLYQQALELFSQLPNTEYEQGTCLMNLGVTFRSLGQLASATVCNEDALTQFDRLDGSEAQKGKCFTNLGSIAYEQGDFIRALSFYDQALDLYASLEGCELQQSRSLINRSYTLQRFDRMSEAHDALARSNELLATCEDPSLIDHLHTAQAILQRKMALHHSPPDRQALLRALHLILPLAIRNDERRYLLANEYQRQRWLLQVAEPRMQLAIALATDLDDYQLAAELIAKWRLSGTVARKNEIDFAASIAEMIPESHEATLAAGDPPSNQGLASAYAEGTATWRGAGPLLHMPHGNRCALKPFIADANSRPHAQYR